jgi:hypothetical protein
MDIEIEDFELTPETTLIRGFWIDLGSRVEKDSGWTRIEWLLKNRLELITEKTVEIGSLYKNPEDNKLWHHYLITPNMQNNSPPVLELIETEKAHELFGKF